MVQLNLKYLVYATLLGAAKVWVSPQAPRTRAAVDFPGEFAKGARRAAVRACNLGPTVDNDRNDGVVRATNPFPVKAGLHSEEADVTALSPLRTSARKRVLHCTDRSTRAYVMQEAQIGERMREKYGDHSNAKTKPAKDAQECRSRSLHHAHRRLGQEMCP